ncbi:hypothetical protein PILCRDRAFT_819696, partial [Piloderma croceum F 1598]
MMIFPAYADLQSKISLDPYDTAKQTFDCEYRVQVNYDHWPSTTKRNRTEIGKMERRKVREGWGWNKMNRTILGGQIHANF